MKKFLVLLTAMVLSLCTTACSESDDSEGHDRSYPIEADSLEGVVKKYYAAFENKDLDEMAECFADFYLTRFEFDDRRENYEEKMEELHSDIGGWDFDVEIISHYGVGKSNMESYMSKALWGGSASAALIDVEDMDYFEMSEYIVTVTNGDGENTYEEEYKVIVGCKDERYYLFMENGKCLEDIFSLVSVIY